MGAPPVVAESSDGGVPAVGTTHTAAGATVKSDSVVGPAVRAHGTSGQGVWYLKATSASGATARPILGCGSRSARANPSA